MIDAPALPPVVDAAWLADRTGAVVCCDVRYYLDGRSGAAAYERGHIPGARFVDLDQVLAGRATPEHGRHPLPEPEDFAAGMRALGICDDDTVVAYDDAGGAYAARLVWMLRVTGRSAALLDGGLSVWPGPWSTTAPEPRQGRFQARPWPGEAIAHLDQVAQAARGVEALVIDVRAAARYRGEAEPIDPRAGHIPGAINLPFAGNLDATTRRFRSPAALRRRYKATGADSGRPVIAYCGSGVTACHALLAMELAGLPGARLYPGSWSQWCADPQRPIAVGATPSSLPD